MNKAYVDHEVARVRAGLAELHPLLHGFKMREEEHLRDLCAVALTSRAVTFVATAADAFADLRIGPAATLTRSVFETVVWLRHVLKSEEAALRWHDAGRTRASEVQRQMHSLAAALGIPRPPDVGPPTYRPPRMAGDPGVKATAYKVGYIEIYDHFYEHLSAFAHPNWFSLFPDLRGPDIDDNHPAVAAVVLIGPLHYLTLDTFNLFTTWTREKRVAGVLSLASYGSGATRA